MIVVARLRDQEVDLVMTDPINRALVNYLLFATLRSCGRLRLTSDVEADSLRRFIIKLLIYSQTPISVILAVPVYLSRLGYSFQATEPSSSPYAMIFGCLIIATKYLMDVGPGSAAWREWLTLSGHQLFYSPQDIINLECEILKRCQWRTDLHEHALLQELDIFEHCLHIALWPTHCRPPNDQIQMILGQIEERLASIAAFVAQLRESCVEYPCMRCPPTVSKVMGVRSPQLLTVGAT